MPSLVENGPVVLEKKIFKSSQCIFTISKLSPLWEGCGPSFIQTWIPFTRGYFVPSLVEIGPVVLEKKFFKSCQFIFIISQLSPLWEESGLSFEQTWIPLPRNTLCQVSLKLAQWFWRGWKCESLQKSGQTDRGGTTGDQKSSLELSAQVSKKVYRWTYRRQTTGHQISSNKIYHFRWVINIIYLCPQNKLLCCTFWT